MATNSCDVIVIGAGNAALCAALSANERGASVIVLERAPREKRGGNTAFTGASYRTVYRGTEDIRKLVPDLSADEIARTDFGEYTAEMFLDDLARMTQYQTDPDLSEILVRQSTATLMWMQQKGIRFVPKYGRQAFEQDGRFKFFGGLAVEAAGGGRGLVEALFRCAQRHGVTVRYGTRAIALLRGRSGIEGVRILADDMPEDIRARAVVLACGGFEANREWRTRCLGPGWDMAKVRGSRYNTGDGLRMALEIGAQPIGQWSGCHAVSWERYAPDFGNLDALADGQRHSYPMGIMVNAEGLRFVDEGADFRNYTYARYGHILLRQPGGYGWQVFDAQSAKFLRSEYKARDVTRIVASSLEELASKLEGIDGETFVRTVREFNHAVRRDIPFNPNIKDGRCTTNLAINKSNWALPLETPPFEAYAIGTAVTFTYGGIKIDTTTRVLDIADRPLAGLYAAGEIVGGIFYFNYPAGSGLTSGAVFGRIAGEQAATYAQRKMLKERKHMTQTAVGIIGAGRMGLPIVGHLVRAGFEVMVNDADAGKRAAVEEKGARWVTSLDDLAQRAQFALICVGYDREVKELLGEESALRKMAAGAVVAILSTVHPRTVQQLALACKPLGIHVVDSTVTGGGRGADAGNLQSFVGGDAEVVAKLTPVLSAYSSAVVHAGAIGSAQVAKAVNNLIMWSCLVANHEGLALAQCYGVDIDALRKALMSSTATNGALKNWGTQTMAWADDDMEIVAKMAKDCGIALRQAEVVQDICRELKPRRYQLEKYGR